MEAKPFSPGRLLTTPGVLEAVPGDRLLRCLQMHLRCHWGDALGHEDWLLNDKATHDGSRILSSFWINPHDRSKGKFWIITEAEGEPEDDTAANGSNGSRAATTALLPDEY